jgi:hypothetical protein
MRKGNQMKTSFATAAAVIALGLLTAATVNAATSNASAEIVTPIAISNTVGLVFGQIAPTIAIGTVTVATNGVRTSSGGVTLGNGGTQASASSFAVTGAALNTYTITLPTTTTLSAAAGAPMTVDTFVSLPASTGTLSALGAQTLLVGATLHVGVSQAPNPYTGTFDVTVAYN